MKTAAETIRRCRTAMKVLSIVMLAVGAAGIICMLCEAFFLPHLVGTTQMQNLLMYLEAGLPSYIVIFALGIGCLWPAVTGSGCTQALVLQGALGIAWLVAAILGMSDLMPGPYALADLCVNIYMVDSLGTMPRFLLLVPPAMFYFSVLWLFAMMLLTVGARYGSGEAGPEDADEGQGGEEG